MDNRTERVALETDRYRIIGDITLPREGFRSRMSDYLNRGEVVFVALVDATLIPLDGGDEIRREFIAVGRHHIQLAYPAND